MHQRTIAKFIDACVNINKRSCQPRHLISPDCSILSLTPHYDTHDVFVLQVAGTKRWSI